jgi:photosystem II stability/assembly factor-like uncharacterized protein
MPFRVIAVLLVAGTAAISSQEASRLEWELTGPSDGQVADIIVSPAGRLFAATTKGLYHSSDDGAHWTRCGETQGDFVRPLKDGRLVVGPTLTRKLSHVDGACQTTDTVTLPTEYNSQPVFRALARLTTGRLLASGSSGLLSSDDEGRQWRQIPLPPGAHADWITSFAIMSSGHVVAASSGSILRSSDGGDTWARIATGTSFHKLGVGSSGTLFGAGAGISRSDDEGTTWQTIAFDRQTVWAVIAVSAPTRRSNSDILFAAVQRPDRFDSAVFRSTDGGATWTPTGSELTGRVTALARTSQRSLIAGTTTGFFRSIDNGASWRFHGVAPAALHVIAADPDGLVVAGIPGAWVAVDSGRTWAPILIGSSPSNQMPGSEGFFGRALFVTRPGRVYAGGQAGVVFSTDRGSTWKGSGLQRDTFAFAELADGTLLAATFHNGIFRSADQGETWIEHSTGLTEFTAIGLSTLSSGSVVAATLHQTFLSADSGLTWVPLTRGFPQRALRPILPKGTGAAAVAAVDATLYELDATHIWKAATIVRSPITSLAWDDAGRLWIGTQNDGVAMARTGTAEWTTSYVGPSAATVFGLAVSRRYVVAATAGGVVRAALPR